MTDDVMTGQVEVNVGGGGPIQAEEWRYANANYVTDFGFPGLQGLAV